MKVTVYKNEREAEAYLENGKTYYTDNRPFREFLEALKKLVAEEYLEEPVIVDGPKMLSFLSEQELEKLQETATGLQLAAIEREATARLERAHREGVLKKTLAGLDLDDIQNEVYDRLKTQLLKELRAVHEEALAVIELKIREGAKDNYFVNRAVLLIETATNETIEGRAVKANDSLNRYFDQLLDSYRLAVDKVKKPVSFARFTKRHFKNRLIKPTYRALQREAETFAPLLGDNFKIETETGPQIARLKNVYVHERLFKVILEFETARGENILKDSKNFQEV